MSRQALALAHVASLIAFYLTFVIGDFLTTLWLIYHDPSGIGNEANVLAAAIYAKYGVTGMLAAKLLMFSIFSAFFILSQVEYGGVRWFREISEVLLLGLMGLSLVILINNVMAMVYFKPSLAEVMPSILVKATTVAVAVTVISLLTRVFKLKNVELKAVAGVAACIFPFIVVENLSYQHYLAYLVTVLTVMSASQYLAERRRRRAV